MKSSDTGSPARLDGINGMLAWWGIPNLYGPDRIEARAQHIRALAVDLNRLVSEASSSQVKALSAANERFAGSLQGLLNARQPSELMAAQSALITDIMGTFSIQTKAWMELTQKAQDCCAAAVRDVVAESD